MLRQEYAQNTAAAATTFNTFEEISLAAILSNSNELFTHKEICDEVLVFTMASLESVSYSFAVSAIII
jgi:hypothetical protein